MVVRAIGEAIIAILTERGKIGGGLGAANHQFFSGLAVANKGDLCAPLQNCLAISSASHYFSDL
jgi:hypothetical protein